MSVATLNKTATKPKVAKTKASKKRRIIERFDGTLESHPEVLSPETTVKFWDENVGSNVEMTARWERITPAHARFVWNNLNSSNRKLKTSSATKIAKAVAAGKFATTGQTIIFDTNGDVQDGQHRIYGIALGDTPVTALVVRGAPPKNFTKIDRGVSRGADDVLHIRGVKNSEIVARVARRVKQFEATRMIGGRAASLENDEVLDFISKHQDIITSVNLTQTLTKGVSQSLVTPTMFAFAHYLLSGYDKSMADEFMRLFSGSPTDLLVLNGDREAIAHLRKRLDELQTEKKKGVNVPDTQILGLILAAWNRFCTDGRAPVSKIQSPPKRKTDDGQRKYTLPKNIRRPTQRAKDSVQQIKQAQLATAAILAQNYTK